MGEKELVEQAVPIVWRLLFRAINALLQETQNMFTIITTLNESVFGLIHINFFIHVGRMEGAVDIGMLAVAVGLLDTMSCHNDI
jgi:hypothetical protein